MKCLLTICAVFTLIAGHGLTAETDRNALEKVLLAPDFLQQAAGRLASWTTREVALISDLSISSVHPQVRLRAAMVLIDLSGNGRAAEGESGLVTAAFRHLEDHADHPVVKRVLGGPRLTHYTVARKSDGSVWILLETIAPGLQRGGINLRWDAEKSAIAELQGWGAFQES